MSAIEIYVKTHYLHEGDWLNFRNIQQKPSVLSPYYPSMLYCPTADDKGGLYCCMGLYGRSIGIPSEFLKYRGYPNTVNARYSYLFGELLRDSKYAEQFAKLNDGPLAMFETLSDRQVKIVKLFKSIGIHVQFVPGRLERNPT